MVKVKICGMTRVADVIAAADAGADMLGFVFAASPRQLSIERAAVLLEAVPQGVTRVALFMNDGEERVRPVIDSLPIELLQFHGSEERSYCADFGLPYIKAVAMGAGSDVIDAAALYPDAAGYLYDGHVSGASGGSGDTFDWSLLARVDKPVWLAGGLTPDNVATAVATVRPWVVDVSSGVEDAPGCKNHELMKSFIRAAKSAEKQ